MMLGAKSWFLSLAFTLAFQALVPGSAHACSWLCPQPLRLFGVDAEVPGNLIYFKVLDDSAIDPVLRTVEGDEIPSSTRVIGNDSVFAPIDPVAEGVELELEYSTHCVDSELVDPAQRVTYRFKARASETLGERPGSLEHVERGARYEQSVFQSLTYWPPVDPWIIGHLADVSATVDGEPLSSSAFNPFHLEVVTHCVANSDEVVLDTCGSVVSVPEGVHPVRATITVVGSSDLPVTETSVATDCAWIAATAVSMASDAGTDPDASAPTASCRNEGGCSLLNPPRASVNPWLLALCGVVLVLGRRRVTMKSRRSPDRASSNRTDNTTNPSSP